MRSLLIAGVLALPVLFLPAPRPTPKTSTLTLGSATSSATFDCSTLAGGCASFYLTSDQQPKDVTFVGPSTGLTVKAAGVDVDVTPECAAAVGMAIIRRETIYFYQFTIEARSKCAEAVIR